MFLELGVLPIRYEIHKRQLSFLHHVVNLPSSDPVRQLFDNMKTLPAEANWYNEVIGLADKYSVCVEEDELLVMSKETYKSTVRAAIERVAFAELVAESKEQKKVQHLSYVQLCPQPYLTRLYPSQSRTIMLCRAKCLDIKAHRPFLHKNNLCRWCHLEPEDVAHISSCGWDTPIDDVDLLDLNVVDLLVEAKLVALATRVDSFIERVDV